MNRYAAFSDFIAGFIPTSGSKDLILGVASQIALVALVVGLAMMAQQGVLNQALAK